LAAGAGCSGARSSIRSRRRDRLGTSSVDGIGPSSGAGSRKIPWPCCCHRPRILGPSIPLRRLANSTALKALERNWRPCPGGPTVVPLGGVEQPLRAARMHGRSGRVRARRRCCLPLLLTADELAFVANTLWTVVGATLTYTPTRHAAGCADVPALREHRPPAIRPAQLRGRLSSSSSGS
jgi:hypothetical protein